MPTRRTFLSLASIAPLAAPALLRAASADAPASPDPAVANEQIATGRQAGLDLLKPSRRDLDHGMELHANSIVLDVYGFGPAAAVDNAELARIINSGASD